MSLCVPRDATAQQPEAPESRTETLRNITTFADTLTLPEAYARELFRYPASDRPDPVLPPPVIAKRDEALPVLVLSAILNDVEDARRSVAVVRTGDRNGRVYRVSVGDRIGEIEILEISGKRVVIGARKLGRIQTDTLSLDRSRRP